MVFVPAVNTAQFSLQYAQGDNSFAENVYCIERTAAWNTAALQAIAAALKTWWGTGDGTNSFKNLMNANAAITGIGYRDMTTQNGLSGVYQTGLPIQAVGSGPAASLGLSFSITARTGLAGRSFRGRTFMCALGTGDFANITLNEISGVYAGNCVSALDALLTAIPAADPDCSVVVVSRFHQPGGPHTPTVPRTTAVMTPVVSYGFHNLFMDFQRRRAPAHNRHG